MGSFSWKCAVSGQSIPADCVEPTEVSLFLPDGTVHTGVYDGYGQLKTADDSADIIQLVNAALRGQSLDVETPKIDGILYDADHLASDGKPEPVFVVDLEGRPAAYCLSFRHATNEAEARAYVVKREKIQATLEAIMRHVKLVKTKYVTADTAYDGLPVSEQCESKGVSYDRPGQWNEPVYEESTMNGSHDQPRTANRPVCRG